MKIAKKMALFMCTLKRTETLSYADLYAAIPLAESTIRGIVTQFLDERWLERVGTGFRLSGRGLRESRELFPRLFPEEHSDRMTVFVLLPGSQARIRTITRLLTDLGAQELRTGVYLLSGMLTASSRRSLRTYEQVLILEHVAVDSLQLAGLLSQTRAGRKYCERREQLAAQLTRLHTRGKIYHRTGKTLGALWKNTIAEMVIQAEDRSLFLEEYFQKEMRILHLCRSL